MGCRVSPLSALCRANASLSCQRANCWAKQRLICELVLLKQVRDSRCFCHLVCLETGVLVEDLFSRAALSTGRPCSVLGDKPLCKTSLNGVGSGG